MSSPNLAISVRNLSKKYVISHVEKHSTLAEQWLEKAKYPFRKAPTETFSALNDVSFDIHKGDVVGIIGRNGAGKSTLLKILSRITEPTEGQIDLYGRVGSLLEVGTGFHPELTGRENIFLNGAILGMKRKEIERQFDAIVAFAEVEKFLDTPVKRFSSGMYVRLAFAVAAHLNPEILIVDEVLAVGDAQFQKKCLGKMRDVSQGDGRTVLFVSHNMPAIRNLCRSCCWLEKGKLVSYGRADEVIDNYVANSNRETQTMFNLADYPRTGIFGREARARKLVFNGGSDLKNYEELNFELELETHSDCANMAVGIGFCSPDGVRLMTLESDLSSPQMKVNGKKTIVVRGRLDKLLLEPGIYVLDLGIRSGYFDGLDSLQNFAMVEVLPGSHDDANNLRSGGGMRFPCQWTWQQDGRALVEN